MLGLISNIISCLPYDIMSAQRFMHKAICTNMHSPSYLECQLMLASMLMKKDKKYSVTNRHQNSAVIWSVHTILIKQ
jgi:hypothetical protein